MTTPGEWTHDLPTGLTAQAIVAGLAMIADNQVAMHLGEGPPYDGEDIVRNMSALAEEVTD